MGVYKRKDSDKWWISYSVAGKLYREPAGTKAQAAALLAKRKLEVFEGRHFPDKKQNDLTMDGLRQLWLEHAAHKKSLRDDQQRFKTILGYFGAQTRVAALQANGGHPISQALPPGGRRANGPHPQHCRVPGGGAARCATPPPEGPRGSQTGRVAVC